MQNAEIIWVLGWFDDMIRAGNPRANAVRPYVDKFTGNRKINAIAENLTGAQCAPLQQKFSTT
ncbi:MAG: hypothetical protein FWH20_08620 [Oscillospiraceae bacterium]|nr:hypothetical protein [Oscillospiraceae bacterium]